MSKDEAKSRWEDLHNHVTTQTAQSFITTFLNRTLRSHAAHIASLSQSSSDPDSVPVFNLSRLLPRYKHSMKRLILIDFEGTLWRRDLSKEGMQNWMLRKEPEWSEDDEAWPKESVELLKSLAEDKKNEVWVLSGLARTGILGKLTKVAPKVGIIAENGCFIKTRTTKNVDGQWISMVSQFNLSWMSSCLEILHYFTERTPNSFIEEREASLVWRFWSGDVDENSADRQWARRQAAEAQNHIFDSLGERFGIRIIPGKNSFLVLPNNISRSTAVAAVMHPGGPARSPYAGRAAWMPPDTEDYGFGGFHAGVGAHGSGAGGYGGSSGLMGGDGGVEETDFMLAISSDERLLRRLNENDGAETVSTSGKGTDARWKVDYEEVRGVLKAFSAVST
ncbi:hypothetical protein H1R20_g15685, partial [Candolleomyces eurysporus]